MKKILSVILLFYASTLFPQVPDNEIIRCSFVGDMMIGTDYPYHVLPPDDGRTYFDNVRKYFSAMDIVFGNLEGALTAVKESRKNVAKKNYYAFRMPVRYADHFKNAGFNIISIANNHSLDFGIKGNNDTRNTLKEAGITVTGEKNKLAVIEKKE